MDGGRVVPSMADERATSGIRGHAAIAPGSAAAPPWRVEAEQCRRNGRGENAQGECVSHGRERGENAPNWCGEGAVQVQQELSDSDSENVSPAGEADDATALAEVKDPLAHVEASRGASWSFCKRPSLDEDVSRCIAAIAADAEGVRRRRRLCLAHWRRRAGELEADRALLASQLPMRLGPTIGKLHIPLLREMLLAACHEDTSLVDDLVAGFPVTGEMHTGGLGTACEEGRGARGVCMGGVAPQLERLRRDCRRVNERTLARAVPCELAGVIWEKTSEESARGMIGPLVPIGQVDLGEVLLVHRFGTAQLREGKTKVRLIDDYRANEANSYACAWERTHNDREDVISEAILQLQEGIAARGSTDTVQVGLEDFVGAFKTVAPCESQRWLMWVLVWNPDAQAWYAGEMLTMPFGAVGGVLAWWRCATAQRTIMRRLFDTIIF